MKIRGLFLGLAILTFTLTGCFHDGLDLDTIDWDRSSETEVISASFCCGFTTFLFVQNYIADATVWGDGRIIWTSTDESGLRSVWEGFLSSDELVNLVRDAAQKGFFGWKDLYEDRRIADVATQCLNITLLTLEKSVCEYYQGAPAAFHTIFDHLASGAGVQNFGPFTPETGYLVALKMTFDEPPTSDQISADWDASDLVFSLADATDGAWVQDKALHRAWEIVNQGIWSNIVHEDGTYYEISLRIPGLSFTDIIE